jgi:hypothetical protein
MRARVLGGAPPVVDFERGAGTGMDSWSAGLQDVSAFATVAAYDRAGIGGSDASCRIDPGAESHDGASFVSAGQSRWPWRQTRPRCATVTGR